VEPQGVMPFRATIPVAMTGPRLFRWALSGLWRIRPESVRRIERAVFGEPWLIAIGPAAQAIPGIVSRDHDPGLGTNQRLASSRQGRWRWDSEF
jgi:hypothetical protein